MIKKTIAVLTMLILSAALMWAIWEGNAAAGVQKDFPSGLFASSDILPKHTLIEITNLEQNITSRAVIIGNTGSDGLLVKVSPDLAAALAIKEGNTVRVRVSVPPLVAEEGADPVLLGKVENKRSAPKVVPEKPAVKQPQVIPAKKTVQNVERRKRPYEEPVQAEPAPPEVSEPVEPKVRHSDQAAKKKVAEVEEPIQPAMEIAPEEPVTPIAEVSEPVLPEPEFVSVPSTVSEVAEPAELLAQSEYAAEAEKPVPGAAPVQKPPTQEATASSDEYAKPVQEVVETNVPEATALKDTPEPVPEVSPSIEPEPEVVGEEEPVKDTEDPVEEPALIAVEPNEEQAEEVEELQNEPEIVAVVEVLPEKDSSKDESVEQHVMLVPSEPRAPNSEDIPLQKESKPAVAAVTQPAEEAYTANVLTKGYFYVQVGRFKDMLNVESFVQMYGKQYPVAIEKSSTAKDVFYKVYVGPLQKDERGAALETFQKLGFKDAFLKKAP